VEGADLLAHEKARADRPSAAIRDERRLVAVAAEQIEEPGDVLVQRALAVGEESCVPQPRGGRHIGGGEPAHKGPGIEIHAESLDGSKANRRVFTRRLLSVETMADQYGQALSDM
jgi:hypothetical protein